MPTFLTVLAQQRADDGGSPLISAITLLVWVVMIASMWKVYSKAGKPGWAAIIPIYNVIVLLQIIGKPLWWIILLFVPLVNIVILFMAYHALSKSFGHGVGFMLGLVFLPFIFYPILAFGSSQYVGPGGQSTGFQPAMA